MTKDKELILIGNFDWTTMKNVLIGIVCTLVAVSVIYASMVSVVCSGGTGNSGTLLDGKTQEKVSYTTHIPIKILIDKNTDPEHVLRIGMSVVPTVIIE